MLYFAGWSPSKTEGGMFSSFNAKTGEAHFQQERIVGSPALSDRHLYLRTARSLYAFGG